MAINPNTAFTAGAIFTADQANRFPRGVMAYTTRTTGFTATTTVQDLGVAVTWTAAASRSYKLSFHCIAQKETSAGTTSVTLTDNSNNQVQAAIGYNLAGTQLPLGGFVVVSPAGGSVTYKLRCSSSSNTSTIQGASTNPIVLICEDLGPA